MCPQTDAVTIYYLEQESPSEMRPKPAPPEVRARECTTKQWMYNRFLYQWVGAGWQWTDKLSWSNAQWQAYAESDALRTWVAYVDGSPAGYYELQKHQSGAVQIMYFGLGAKFLSRGYGGYLLTHALNSAWSWQASKVEVNTCSLDHPSALANYQARGMKLVRTEVRSE